MELRLSAAVSTRLGGLDYREKNGYARHTLTLEPQDGEPLRPVHRNA